MKDYDTLEDNVRNTFMSVVWTHKIQEKQADIYSSQYKILETIRLFLSAFTSVGLVALLFSNQTIIKIISATISFGLTFLNAYFKSFNMHSQINAHKSTANKLLSIRDQLRLLLLNIIVENKPVESIIQRYEVLVDELNEIYMDAPQTTDAAVDEATRALNVKKDNNFTDEEIDLNLPKSLRRSDF